MPREARRAADAARHGGACYLQFVTYSSHHPFVIPEELHRIRLRQEMPRRLRDYLTAVNYVDHVLGEFIAALRRNPRLSDAMIVITGDHEGLASERPALVSSAAGRGLVSEGRFTPLIVVNAPAAMRCTDTVGQIDIYPTLLDLLGLDDYHWHGLGRSLLRADAPRAAVDPRLERVGAAVDSTTEQHLRQAWSLSDRIIRSDYFRHTGRE
nr:sulfatase-like hydrolase/transferase [uncultured Alistipes sp.]